MSWDFIGVGGVERYMEVLQNVRAQDHINDLGLGAEYLWPQRDQQRLSLGDHDSSPRFPAMSGCFKIHIS